MDGDALQVQMLGGFSVVWKGVAIAGGAKVRESQFVYLLQLLLHHRREGVSRSRLEETLFGDREIDDISHALRSVIYNARKRLLRAGLPKADYIRQKNGMFYWAGEVPVEEDAKHFEELCYQAREARAAEDSQKCLEILLEACYCYSGEFLPQQIGMVWAAQEARRYQAMFFACVEEAAALLQLQEDWPRMRELGLYASKVSPFADWEVITMEALVAMGQLGEARKLYDDTVDLYMREQGVHPSERLLEKLGAQLHHRFAVLDSIQSEMTDNDREEGGYLCSYPVFQGIYHMIARIMERGGQSVYLMLCTVVDSKGNPMTEGTMLEELSQRLEEAICQSVRHGDAVTRYGRGQYLVLLVNTTRENCTIVQKRIDYRFLVGRQRTGVQYYVNSVVCPADS